MRKFQFMTIRNERQFRALTGISQKAFDTLLPEFTQCLESAREQNYNENQGQRKRKPGGGRKGALPSPEMKLFFLLFYLKTYPTFDVIGCLFDLSPSKAEENVIRLIPLLKQAEQRLHILPHRHLKPIIDNVQHDEKTQEIIIDATERPYCRPQHARKQKHYYSGKKHCHTLKNTVISDAGKGILVIGPTAPGSQHDYALLKKELDPNQPGLSSVEVSVDLGYQGIRSLYPAFREIHIPYKKSKKSESNPTPTLTSRQKKENRAISRVRVEVEHLIGDMKSFQILAIKFRNHIKNMSDRVILVVAGLCNLNNGYVVQ